MSRGSLSSLLVVFGTLLSVACQQEDAEQRGQGQDQGTGGSVSVSPASPQEPDPRDIQSVLASESLKSGEKGDRFLDWAEENFGDSSTPYLEALNALTERGMSKVELKWLASASIKRTQSMAEIRELIDEYFPVSMQGPRYAELIHDLPLERVSEVEAVFTELGRGKKRLSFVNPLVYRRLVRDSLPDTAKWISELPYPEERERGWSALLYARVEKGTVPKEELAVMLKLTDYHLLRTKLEKLLGQE